METKRFHVRTILTVTTGRLLTRSSETGNGIEDLYSLLGHMTSDEPFTHSLGRFAEECKPWLLRWFPLLAKAETESHDNELTAMLQMRGEQGIDEWWQSLEFSEFYDVPKIPADDHERTNPVAELAAMMGGSERIIVVETE